jgi:hypothetical protein
MTERETSVKSPSFVSPLNLKGLDTGLVSEQSFQLEIFDRWFQVQSFIYQIADSKDSDV